MKLKFIAMLAIMAGCAVSSCSDDDNQVLNYNTSYAGGSKVESKDDPKDEPKDEPEGEEPSGPAGEGEIPADIDLSDYFAQKSFNLSSVELSNVSYITNATYQKVEGLGAMLTPKYWAPSPTTNQIDYCYMELGLKILRLYIYPDKNNWGQDMNVIKQAVADGAIIIACPWEAPGNMVETVNEIVWTDGTKEQMQKDCKHLKQQYWKDYANHLIDYVAYMKKQGVEIYAMSVQNEPDAEFMYWSPKEIASFTEKYGAYIVKNTGVKLMTPEACGMRDDYTNQILNNKAAYGATNIIAGHLYQGFSNFYGTAHNNGYVKNRYNYINGLWDKIKADGKQWWMTEHLFNDGEKSSNPSDWQFLNWDYCLNHLGLEIHDCMAGSCSAYIYWYLKRFYGLIYDNDDKGRSGSNKENSYSHNAFIMAQWARFATGKTRINASCDDKDIKLTAYKSDNGKELSFVAINLSQNTKYLSIEVEADKFFAHGLISDKDSQKKQKLTKVIPNSFSKRVVLTIPAMGIGSVSVIQ